MRAGAVFALLACAAAGAAFTLTRAAVLAREPVPVTTHGMCAPAELLGRERLTYPPGICVIELPDDGWRPLRISLALRATGVALTAQTSVNAGPPANITANERWTTHHVSVPPRLPDATRITLRIEVPAAAASRDGDPPIQVGRIDITRELTTTRKLRDGLAGALAAIVLWWLIRAEAHPAKPRPTEASPAVRGGPAPVWRWCCLRIFRCGRCCGRRIRRRMKCSITCGRPLCCGIRGRRGPGSGRSIRVTRILWRCGRRPVLTSCSSIPRSD